MSEITQPTATQILNAFETIGRAWTDTLIRYCEPLNGIAAALGPAVARLEAQATLEHQRDNARHLRHVAARARVRRAVLVGLDGDARPGRQREHGVAGQA